MIALMDMSTQKPKSPTTSFSIPKELVDELDTISKEMGINNRSIVLAMLLRKYLPAFKEDVKQFRGVDC